MDSSYYQNNLKFLYESADSKNPAVYNVDNLLYTYTSQDTFNNNVIPASFFTRVTGTFLKREDVVDVSTRMNEKDSTNPPFLPTSQAFTDDAPANEVRVEVNRDTSSYNSFDIMEKVKENLDLIERNSSNSAISTVSSAAGDVTKSHSLFDDYMRGIVSAACLKCMQDAASKVYPVNGNANVPINLDQAGQVVTNTVASNASRMKQVFQALSDTCRETLREFFANINEVRTDIMANFNNSGSSFTRPLYYVLRDRIINRVQFSTSSIPDQEDNVMIYIKRIFADIYLRTCYPLLQYDFIDAMMRRYATNGDYVNVRIALLAKVFFTYYFIDYVNKVIFSNDSNLSLERKNQYNDMFSKINTNINNYMTSLNNIDVNVEPGKNVMSDIIRSLHKLSDTVVRNSKDTDTLKQEIVVNQQGLRNIIANNEIMKETFNIKRTEFWIVLVALVVVVCVCGALLIMNMTQYVFYIAGAIMIIVFIMKLVEWIRAFFG